MSDIDFQNGMIVGLALRGLHKANIPVGFLNYFIFKFLTGTYPAQTINLTQDAITVALATFLESVSYDLQVPTPSSLSGTFSTSVSITTGTIAVSTVTFSDSASSELT